MGYAYLPKHEHCITTSFLITNEGTNRLKHPRSTHVWCSHFPRDFVDCMLNIRSFVAVVNRNPNSGTRYAMFVGVQHLELVFVFRFCFDMRSGRFGIFLTTFKNHFVDTKSKLLQSETISILTNTNGHAKENVGGWNNGT